MCDWPTSQYGLLIVGHLIYTFQSPPKHGRTTRSKPKQGNHTWCQISQAAQIWVSVLYPRLPWRLVTQHANISRLKKDKMRIYAKPCCGHVVFGSSRAVAVGLASSPVPPRRKCPPARNPGEMFRLFRSAAVTVETLSVCGGAHNARHTARP